MIFEMMQRQKLLNYGAQTGLRSYLASTRPDDPTLAGLLTREQLEPQDLKRGLEYVEGAVAELGESSKDEPRLDASFFPRDAPASQLQTILQRYFLEHKLTQKHEGLGATEVDHPISDVTLTPAVQMTTPDRLFDADAGWIACWAAKAVRFATGGRHPFLDRAAPPKRVADNVRIYLLGDWGSGISRAKKIGDRIRAMLETEQEREQHVIHLGDVYYSGWPEEYEDHFLPAWPVAAGKEDRYGSWCLNANHDMFSGGHGYFEHLLKDKRFRGHHGSSYFSLETKHWQILGLDSAWKDKDLAGRQFDWVEERQAAEKYKKLILMTHHQPFSAFEEDCVNLQRLLHRNKVTAWFWGHEHRFALYKARPDLPYGRLIGHGGVPVWAPSSSTPDMVAYLGTRSFRSGLEKFALFGFAVLDFDKDIIRVRYFDEHGEEERNEIIR